MELQGLQDTIVLNSYGLVIREATIEGVSEGSVPSKALRIRHDEGRRIVTLEFGDTICNPNRQSRLSILFDGVLSNTMTGFYRSSYTTDEGENMYMFSTKCEVSQYNNID